MADRIYSDFSEDDLECSSSSFEEDSGESSLDEEEDRLELRFQRPDVRPYQFEPARNVENGDVDDGSDNSDLDPEMRDNWYFFFIIQAFFMSNAEQTQLSIGNVLFEKYLSPNKIKSRVQWYTTGGSVV